MRKIFIFLSLCITQMATAQPATDTAFKTLGIADGLRSNSVTSVLADSRGYLWIGTYQGLNRYDGHQVKTRFPESGDPSFFDGRSGRRVCEMVSLPQTTGASQNNAIRDMMDDQRGNIWIATDHKGLFVYNKNTGAITSLRHERTRQLSLASDNATCMTIDRKGTIWVGHLKTGLSYTSDANNMMQSHAQSAGDILTMVYDTKGNLWMGTDGDGVYIEHKDGSIVKTALPNITVIQPNMKSSDQPGRTDRQRTSMQRSLWRTNDWSDNQGKGVMISQAHLYI